MYVKLEIRILVDRHVLKTNSDNAASGNPRNLFEVLGA